MPSPASTSYSSSTRRWCEAELALPAAQQQQSLAEGPVGDAIDELGIGLTGSAILHELDTHHEAATPDIADTGKFLLQLAHSRKHPLTHLLHVRQRLLYDVECRECGGTADRIAAEGGTVGPGFQVITDSFAIIAPIGMPEPSPLA